MQSAMVSRKRRLVYGSGFGAVAFLVGWGITLAVVPLEFAWPRADPLKTGSWVWLAAHSMEVTGGSLARFHQRNPAITVGNLPTLAALRALPPILTAFAAVLAIDAISNTSRPVAVFLNGTSTLVGYLGLGLLVFLLYDARPAVSLHVVAVGLVSAAFALVWVTIDFLRLESEVFGLAILGWALAIALVIFAGGEPVLNALLPFVFVSIGGMAVGSLSIFAIRRYAW